MSDDAIVQVEGLTIRFGDFTAVDDLTFSIKRGEIFTADNVRRLRIVSWCCVGAALLCLVSALYYPSFLLVTAAAGFMCLIVRVVKNVFQQAISMKSELDLTI